MAKIKDLIFDVKNANKGTARGCGMLEKSLSKYGAGRSILLDKNNRIIAGNKTAACAGEIGMDNVQIVESDGSKIIAVKRTDLDLNDKPARALAFADNRVAEIDLDWSAEEIARAQLDGVDIEDFFTQSEIDNLTPIDMDYEKEWEGMPEFDNPQKAFKSIYVHFENIEDFNSFIKIVKQNINEKTKSIWYPEKKRENMKDIGYINES